MLEISNDKLQYCYTKFKEIDKKWIKRKRKIDTASIFELLTASAITNTGVSTKNDIFNKHSHVALIKARKKLPTNMFKEINTSLHSDILKKNNIFAVDGSKVKMLKGKEKYGYTSRTNNQDVPRPAKNPICMLSALTGIQTDTIVNYTITKHFNERTCVRELVKPLKKDDILLFDRGYYSKDLFTFLDNSKLKCVMRIKKTANRTVKKFYNSRSSKLTSVLFDENGEKIKIRYFKKRIDGTLFVMCTNIFNCNVGRVMELYKMRWRVELSFKRLKSHLFINKIKALTEILWLQEFESRILLDSLSRCIQVSLNSVMKHKTLYTYILLTFYYHCVKNKINIYPLHVYGR